MATIITITSYKNASPTFTKMSKTLESKRGLKINDMYVVLQFNQQPLCHQFLDSNLSWLLCFHMDFIKELRSFI